MTWGIMQGSESLKFSLITNEYETERLSRDEYRDICLVYEVVKIPYRKLITVLDNE